MTSLKNLLKKFTTAKKESKMQQAESNGFVYGKIVKVEGNLLTFQVEGDVSPLAVPGSSFSGFLVSNRNGDTETMKAAESGQQEAAQNESFDATLPLTSEQETVSETSESATLREIINSPEMRDVSVPTLFALGKDASNTPVLCDLKKAPHLLLGGAPGSGKTTLIHACVCSLISRTSPQQVRLLLIGREGSSLKLYEGLPHLLTPVITDPRKGSRALSWVVQEMMDRYTKFSRQGVRNLDAYNNSMAGMGGMLARIIVIIDDLTDMMTVCRKEMEEAVRRLGALARAAGIHMVLASQRVTADVISAPIQNNLPSRIAFALPSVVNSRRFIDEDGAEQLHASGEMLYKAAGTQAVYVKGCFVSTEEIEGFVREARSRYQTEYDPNIMDILANSDTTPLEGEKANSCEEKNQNDSDKYSNQLRQAVSMAVENSEISIRRLQQNLHVGYARASRLIDEMEMRGIIGPANGTGLRKTLLSAEAYQELIKEE